VLLRCYPPFVVSFRKTGRFSRYPHHGGLPFPAMFRFATPCLSTETGSHLRLRPTLKLSSHFKAPQHILRFHPKHTAITFLALGPFMGLPTTLVSLPLLRLRPSLGFFCSQLSILRFVLAHKDGPILEFAPSNLLFFFGSRVNRGY
jgi:hypothetical protein